MEKEILKVKNTPRIRKSPNRKRITIEGKQVWVSVRGSKRFYIYTFERFNDIYCLILKDISFPIVVSDGFKKEDLKKVLNTEEDVIKYLKSIPKDIIYSTSSLQQFKLLK